MSGESQKPATPNWTQDDIDHDMFRDEEPEDHDRDPGEDCGRWDNGRLMPQCRKAGSEECDWECPYSRSGALSRTVRRMSGER